MMLVDGKCLDTFGCYIPVIFLVDVFNLFVSETKNKKLAWCVCEKNEEKQRM